MQRHHIFRPDLLVTRFLAARRGGAVAGAAFRLAIGRAVGAWHGNRDQALLQGTVPHWDKGAVGRESGMRRKLAFGGSLVSWACAHRVEVKSRDGRLSAASLSDGRPATHRAVQCQRAHNHRILDSMPERMGAAHVTPTSTMYCKCMALERACLGVQGRDRCSAIFGHAEERRALTPSLRRRHCLLPRCHQQCAQRRLCRRPSRCRLRRRSATLPCMLARHAGAASARVQRPAHAGSALHTLLQRRAPRGPIRPLMRTEQPSSLVVHQSVRSSSH